MAQSVLISAPPKETPFLTRDGRISDPWLVWLQSVTSVGIVVQTLQTLQTIAEDNSTDGNNGTVAAELLDAIALLSEPRRAAPPVDTFDFPNTRPPEATYEAPTSERVFRAELDELRALITAGEPSPLGATLGAGRGVSGSITIPKLTTANGSITVVDGIITGFVNPT